MVRGLDADAFPTVSEFRKISLHLRGADVRVEGEPAALAYPTRLPDHFHGALCCVVLRQQGGVEIGQVLGQRLAARNGSGVKQADVRQLLSHPRGQTLQPPHEFRPGLVAQGPGGDQLLQLAAQLRGKRLVRKAGNPPGHFLVVLEFDVPVLGRLRLPGPGLVLLPEYSHPLTLPFREPLRGPRTP